MRNVIKQKILMLCLLLLSSGLSAQQFISGVVNKYQRVTGINYCTNVINLPTTPLFDIGDKVMIIQMKGASIDQTNTASYGDINSINSAGKFEFGYVVAKTFNTVTLKAPVINLYDVNAFVQLVYVPVYTTDVVINGTLNCNTWNASIGVGGVIAIDATGHSITLAANITASGRGFAGGTASNNGFQLGCAANYYYSAPEDSAAWKGEGISVIPSATQGAGRGKLANGGGGGNEINAGGAGGSNAGIGGLGGWSFGTSSTPPCSTQSDGGLSLTPYFGNNTAFLGGGGGGGHQNDNHQGHGARGGGIIMLFCDNLDGNGFTISANGAAAADVAGGGNSDGGGGGGGAGTILLYTNSFGGTAFTLSASGGDGANNDGASTNYHGPGGGGGGGRIASKIAIPGYVTTQINGGVAGLTQNGLGINYGAHDGGIGEISTGLDLPFEEIPAMPDQITQCSYSELNFDAAGPSEYSYTWTGPGISPISSSLLNVNPLTLANDGFFILKLASPHCSTSVAYDTIDVTVEECCPYLNETFGYQIIDASTYGPITSNEVWDGKVLIRGGILEVQGSAVLDITNVDVVFDECSGIRFIDNSILRANNSVFRSCQPEKTWVGVELLTQDNIIDECVFKNAMIALNIQNGASAKIHNNLFLNYGAAVNIVNCSAYPYTISGNRFVIDEDLPVFEPCGWSRSYSSGILVQSSSLLENITQNFFVNHNTTELSLYRGIEFQSSDASITSNTFTNVYRAIDILFNNHPVNVENNVIEITRTISASALYMINLSNTYSPVFVFNNRISDPNLYTAGALSAGIYSDYASSLNISHNEIIGFETGIELYYVFNSIVSENHIKNAMYGIYNEDCQIIEISCNEIDLNFEVGGPTCVGIYNMGLANQSRVHSNCILDTRTAIHFTTFNFGEDLPIIRNNFMYNYTDFGIFSSGYQGVVGSTGPDAGMNTFHANSNAMDIFNASPSLNVDSWNNYNVVTFNPPFVNVLGANDMYSTASCGKHTVPIGTMQQNLDATLHCNDFNFVQGFIDFRSGKFTLPKGFRENENLFTQVDACITALYSLETKEEKQEFYAYVMGSDVYSVSEKAMVQIAFTISKGELALAEQLLGNFGAQNEAQELWKISTSLYLEVRGGNALSFDKLANWKAEYASDAQRINMLNTYLKSHDLVSDYHFQTKKIQTAIPVNSDLKVDATRLQLFPNPASNELNVVVAFSEESERVLTITDIQGRTIKVINTPLLAGVVKVDISDLAPGAYIIHLNGNKDSALAERFVKY